MHALASRRILRLALGTSLCLAFSQAVAWQLSFIAPIITLMILSTPMPVFGLKKGLAFMLAMLLPVIIAMGMLPFLMHARWAGILMLALALFYSFHFTAKGGPAVLGTFITIGLTLVVTIGSVSPALMTTLVESLALGLLFGLCFVWIAHALLPDRQSKMAAAQPPRPKPAAVDSQTALRGALKALLVVLPLALVFLFISGSTSYTAVMIKVASMGQQATTEDSRKMGRSLLFSTFWGGVGAIAIWYLLSIWPSLLLYCLAVALIGLIFGRRIFVGKSLAADAGNWSYAYLTMIVIIAPSVLDGFGSDGATSAFWFRIGLFVAIAVYGSVAVAVFDAFWPERKKEGTEPPADHSTATTTT